MKLHHHINHKFLYIFKQQSTVKIVLSGHSKIEKAKVLKPCCSLIQVKSTAESSTRAFTNIVCAGPLFKELNCMLKAHRN